MDLNRYRVIDVTRELMPGELKMTGERLEGEPMFGRPVELREFIAYTARMHFLETETHTGTHMEAPYKYFAKGRDVASMPLSCFMGEAVACDFTAKRSRAAITVEDFRKAGVKRGDIVLAWAGGSFDQRETWPYVVPAAIQWLIRTRIRMIAMEHIYYSPPGTAYGKSYADYKLLRAGIPILDAPIGLNRIKRRRVFFMALPVRMRRVSAAWCRAVVFEEK